jgi:hypothetical protein
MNDAAQPADPSGLGPGWTTWSVAALDVVVELQVPIAVAATVRSALAFLTESRGSVDAAPSIPSAQLRIDDDRSATGAFRAVNAAGVHIVDEDVRAIAIAGVTAAAVLHSRRLCIHAGVLSHRGGALVIPGTSGHGKTTLVAALVQAGFGYLSDEVLALDRGDATLVPFARPLAIGADVWSLLQLDPAERPAPGREGFVDPLAIGQRGQATTVSDIVLSRRTGGPPRVERVTGAEAVAALLRHSFNHFQAPESSFRLTAQVVRNASVWLATYTDAPALAAALSDRFGVLRSDQLTATARR